MRLLLILLATGAVTAAPAQAQHSQPYAGQQTREIKALSADEVSAYLAGAGMGYAKAAELNGYPGPMHALELAEEIHLTADQRTALRKLMEAHKANARSIGAKFVQSEREIEALFRQGDVDQSRLAGLVELAAKLQGEYRLSHLETHREVFALLTPEQVALYSKLRGYGGESHTHHPH